MNPTTDGATMLGRRLGAILAGVIGAVGSFCYDWTTPRWSKILYIGFYILLLTYGYVVVALTMPWSIRILMLSGWLALWAAYAAWTPTERLILIYRGVTGYGMRVFLLSRDVIRNDGPRGATDVLLWESLDASAAYLISSYCLTHSTLIWALAKWTFVWVGIPGLCLGAALYPFRHTLSLNLRFNPVVFWIMVYYLKVMDFFDLVESQLVEQLPRYLQHKWSSYQQALPGRARLPTYQYRPLNEGEFRLLVLKRSSFYPSVIRAEVVHLPINPPPEYEAVSYRWGSPDLTDEIIVDGCRFLVTKGAFDLLLSRRSMWRDRILWIDAICINQADVAEKNEQVQLMRDIYHQASRVVAYPGSDWRFRLAASLIYGLLSTDFYFDDTKTMRGLSIPGEAKSPRWMALGDLFSNEYFNRAWVIQEIAMGQKVELYLGGVYVPWMLFTKVGGMCYGADKRTLIGGSNHGDKRKWRMPYTMENIAVMSMLRLAASVPNSSLERPFDLEYLLFITFCVRATDPRDKVFGLIGIARNTGDSSLTVPDYSLSTDQVFQNTAQAIFSLPPERQTVHNLALAGTGFRKRPGNLPSWVPDFTAERLCCPFAYVVGVENGYRASGDLQQDLVFDDRTNSLIVRAITVDRVVEMSEFGQLNWGFQNLELIDSYEIWRPLQAFFDAAIALCRKHASPSEATDECIYERLWLVLIAGRIQRRHADVMYKDVFRYWLRFINTVNASGVRDKRHLARLIEEGALDGNYDFIKDGSLSTYYLSLQDACYGRQIAITESGRLCIVPPLTTAGDSVIIPLGSQTPFLIRQRHHQSDDIGYELVGEAWVERVMLGEMIGNAEEELIRIS